MDECLEMFTFMYLFVFQYEVFCEGHPIIRVGNRGTRMYFIKSGEVDISDAKGVSLTTLSVTNQCRPKVVCFFGHITL